MNVPTWVWLATIGGLVALLALDLFIVDRRPHEVTTGEAARWVVFYIGCAILFGLGIWYFSGGQYATEFFAGYITEYSLSVDNLFIFVVIMTAFSVPSIHQHRVLLIGIVLALIMRGLFIALGTALIANFSWVFYLFGALLIGLGIQQLRQQGDEDEGYTENVLLRGVRKLLPVTDSYDGTKLTTRIDGRRFVTPMLVVMISIGTADLIFALDSIPAIFGLTREAFLVFTANAFALMGLRQLYFLIGGLLRRLVYLSIGMGVILSFIGVKLVLEALHENKLPFINGGEHLDVWTPSITQSLGVIVSVFLITTVASLLKSRKDVSAVKHLS